MPLRLAKRHEPEANWVNFGCPNSPEEAEENEDADDSPNNNPPPRKKLRLSKEQSRLLEETFRQNHTLNPKQKEELAQRLCLRPRQVEVWFQNRRARSKLKEMEVECEDLKRWFGSLTEQNRKLLKEVEELRGVKLGPLEAEGSEPRQAKSISMCPRCKRVCVSSYVDKPEQGPTSTADVSDKVAAEKQCRQSQSDPLPLFCL